MFNQIETLHSKDKYQLIWDAIAENRLQDAKDEIAKHAVLPSKSLLSLFNKRDAVLKNVALQVTSEILDSTTSKSLQHTRLSIEKEGSAHFADLVRLLFALERNGHFTNAIAPLFEKILELLADLTDQVIKQAGDYPNISIMGYVWASGADIRQCCIALATYFEQLNQLKKRAYVLHKKCSITCSIMNHYPYTVGPDMIETALALEATGENEMANNLYNAVIVDFEVLAREIRDALEEDQGVTAEDIVVLTSLKQAYENSNRINNTQLHTEQLQSIDAIIEKGVTYVPEEDDEED